MKRGSTLFLKTVLLAIALVTVVGMIWFPQTEGRAANLDLLSIYLDPFIIYLYIGTIPFFTALYQAFRLLGYIEHKKAFTQQAVNTLRSIKYSALIIVVLLLGALAYIIFGVQGEDRAGAVSVGVCITFASIVIATAAAVFQKLLQHAVDMKSENDLTV